MKTVTQIAALTTALLLGSATLAGPATTARAGDMPEITWSVSSANDDRGAPTIEFRHDTSNTSFSLDNEADLNEIRAALGSQGSVAFTLDREPGILTCLGSNEDAYEGRGSCTFAADKAFEAELRARNLAPDGDGELLAMTLLGANRALIDGLTREGVAPESSDDVIAAAALEVTPEYVASLKVAGLTLDKLDDAIACRALEVDADYVRALADAGYHPKADDVVAMKAVGVTPEYARRMNAAAQN